MDNLGNVLALMAAVVVGGCLAWGGAVWLRQRHAIRRFAKLLEDRPEPAVQAALDRARLAVAELRRDVERWERGEQP